MTATAVAAYQMCQGGLVEEGVDLVFPDGTNRTVNIDGSELHSQKSVTVWSFKDAGEDVDVTNRVRIISRVTISEGKIPVEAKDFDETIESLHVVLRGGSGVGLVTRIGLDVPVGKAAINPSPRKMLLENLLLCASQENKNILVEVSIDEGEKIARRTLNTTLGIKGGLSILGTTGLVIPCSHEAYVATIEILLRGASKVGEKTAILVTGGRTHRWAKTAIPSVPEQAIVRFGDFIYEALDYCGKYHFEQVHVVCMVGKLAKYALGIPNTHARKKAQSTRVIADLLVQEGMPTTCYEIAVENVSIRGFLECMSVDARSTAIKILFNRAEVALQEWAGDSHVVLHVLDVAGEREIVCG